MNFYNALTSLTPDSEGIKGMKVFYDTLHLVLRVKDGSDDFDVVLLEKLNFNFEENSFGVSDFSNHIIFGKTGNDSPSKSNSNSYCDTVFLEKTKELLICGLSSLNVANDSFIPVVYKYNLNESLLEKIFPNKSIDLEEWKNLKTGELHNDDIPVISYNFDQNILSYIFSTVDQSNNNYNIINISFKWDNFNLNLYNYDIYTSELEEIQDFKLIKAAFLDKNNTLVIAKNGEYLIPIKLHRKSEDEN